MLFLVDISTTDKTLPIHYYARCMSLDKDVLTQLIALASDKFSVNYQNRSGETPLHRCCLEAGHEEAARILIHKGTNK